MEIKRGKITGIIGYSGAGKSTLIRLLNRLETPSSGEILLNGENILDLPEVKMQDLRKNIGMIFQHFNLLNSRDVQGNIAFSLEVAKQKRSYIKERVDELLNLVGLKDKEKSYPSMLSGGQKQRVAIARALANAPSLLLCDEATSALDTKSTKSILSLLKDVREKLNITIVLITHQIEVVKSICDEMFVLSNGSIVEQGEVKSIFLNPKTDTTKALLSGHEDLSLVEVQKDLKEDVEAFKDIDHFLEGVLIYKVTFKESSLKSVLNTLKGIEFEILDISLKNDASFLILSFKDFLNVKLAFNALKSLASFSVESSTLKKDK